MTNLTVYGKIFLTRPESNLLSAIAKVKYGELLDVEIEDAEETPLTLSEEAANEVKLIELIREGQQQLNKIIVHDGHPVSVEYEANFFGIKAIVKHRL